MVFWKRSGKPPTQKLIVESFLAWECSSKHWPRSLLHSRIPYLHTYATGRRSQIALTSIPLSLPNTLVIRSLLYLTLPPYIFVCKSVLLFQDISYPVITLSLSFCSKADQIIMQVCIVWCCKKELIKEFKQFDWLKILQSAVYVFQFYVFQSTALYFTSVDDYFFLLSKDFFFQEHIVGANPCVIAK